MGTGFTPSWPTGPSLCYGSAWSLSLYPILPSQLPTLWTSDSSLRHKDRSLADTVQLLLLWEGKLYIHCVCACLSISVCIDMCISVHIHTHACLDTHASMCTCVSKCLYLDLSPGGSPSPPEP